MISGVMRNYNPVLILLFFNFIFYKHLKQSLRKICLTLQSDLIYLRKRGAMQIGSDALGNSRVNCKIISRI